MLDLFKQFFSFKKFMKDRLVTSFFYLGLVVIASVFLAALRTAFLVMEASIFGGLFSIFVACFILIFLFVGWRLVCELMVTVFHINDNLSPDGGKSDLAEIDPFETAREAAANATKKASESTKSALDKTKAKLAERKDGKIEEVAPDYDDPTPPKKAPAKKKPVAKKATAKKPVVKKAAAKKPIAKKTATKKPAAKKTTTQKPAAKPKK